MTQTASYVQVAIPKRYEIDSILHDWMEPDLWVQEKPGAEWLVVRVDGYVVAYVEYKIRDTIIIYYLEVMHEYRGNKYGKMLVETLKKKPCVKIIADNVLREARPFWKKIGFTSDNENCDYENDWYWYKEG